MKIKTLFLAFAILSLFSCSNDKSKIKLFETSEFTATLNNRNISLYTLCAGDITMQVTNFGARVVSLWVPDRDGNHEDVVLGYENIDRYINNSGERFLGAVVGRYANRIANGQFELEGVQYQLSTYNNGQCLHGGDKGFDMVVWDVVEVSDNQLVLAYTSPDMEEGFPGTLTTKMTYTLTPENEFIVDYEATTDKTTIVNISHHSFFNLKGESKGTITDHIMTINASRTTPVDKVLIPTGELADVANTPFDFRKPATIGERIDVDNEQLKNGLGYDHNWVLDRVSQSNIELAATVYEPNSGRYMEVWTDQPALQFYSGNFFDGTTIGKHGGELNFREAFALETQKYPDSPNNNQFPSTTLTPEDVYKHKCIYKFSSNK